MLHFHPQSPDPFLQHDADMSLAKFGHINAIIDSTSTLIGTLIGADLNTTNDQLITLTMGDTDKWVVTNIIMTNASTNITTATGGDFFTLPSSAGVHVAGATSNTNIHFLTTSDDYISMSNTRILARTTAGTGRFIYFNIQAAQNSAATCDIYIFGFKLPG